MKLNNVEVSLLLTLEFEDTRERDQIMQGKIRYWVVENDNCDGRISVPICSLLILVYPWKN
jgi:hypothetical protein